MRRVELAGEVADRVLRVVAEITERWEEVIDDAGLTAPRVDCCGIF